MTPDDEDEEALWGAFTKGMKKLPRPPEPPGAAEEKAASKPRRRKDSPENSPSLSLSRPDIFAARPSSFSSSFTSPAAASGFPGADLDRRTEEKLLSGRMPIDGRLDLHGMTQAQAERALGFFIEESLACGRRTLLVITGKGRGGALASETAPEDWISPAPGVLRQNMPRWLESPAFRPHILKIVPAQPRHGGSGAFYIYLRRARS